MIARMILVGTLCLALSPDKLGATPISFAGLRASYTPGSSLVFDVVLPEITDLGSYHIDLLLTADQGVAGTDFYFNLAATMAAASSYVFPSTANYFDAANIDSPLQHRLTLSDFDFSGIMVVAGVNDLVATVVIGTAASFTGELTLSVDVEGLILDTPIVAQIPVPGFDTIRTDTLAAGAATIVPVPEPTSTVLLFMAFGMALHRSIRRN